MNGRFIVTGGAGLIGSNIVQALNARGCNEIIIVDHLNHPKKQENIDRLHFVDYFDKTDFRGQFQANQIAPVTGVFHMGACSSTTEMDENYLDDNNFNYTKELCLWALKTGARFVYASSAATYGDGSKGYCDADEITPDLEPLNLYGKSKQKFDMWALQTGNVAKIAGLKYFNVYGPGEDHKGDMRSLVNKAYSQILTEGRIKLFRSHLSGYQDGEQTRDFIFVDDAVAVSLYMFDNPAHSGIFNCGTGQARTWIDLARALFDAMARPVSIEFIDMPPSIREKYQYHTEAEMTKLRTAGFTSPFQTIESGVRKYVLDYLNIRKSDAS